MNFQVHQRKEIKDRRKFRFIRVSNTEDQIVLCSECTVFLTDNNKKKAKKYEYIWPSFIWSFITNSQVQEYYNDLA